MEEDDNENVTLVLDNQRFKVNKKKLMNKSQYFATLLSKNFKDYSLSEHDINYKIPVISFQDFINFINCDKHNVIIKAIENNVERLLTLLKLSILFAVKDELMLTETIINILQNRDLTPQDALNVWSIAQEFSFNMLRDLSFSVCLDRFTELPLNLICELSKKNFLHLVGHTNLRIPKIMNAEAYLSTVAQEWMKVNEDTISLDILKKTEGPKVYQSFVLYNRHNYHENQEFYLHCWDGDKFFEFATGKCPEELINKKIPIMGMQIIARGHNLYFIGGESCIKPKIFNTKVWRYSLITKKWHFATTMPCERKKMIAAFVQNKLLLAGGYGSNNQRLKSLDIYDVHKGTWTEGMDIPFKYPDFYWYCNVVDKYLICFNFFYSQDGDSLYIYNSEMNYWCKVAIIYERKLHLHDLHMTAIIKQFRSATGYTDICLADRMRQDGINLKTIVCDNPKYKQEFYKKYAKYLRIEEKYKDERNFDMYFYFIEISYKMYDYYVLFCSKNENVKGKLIHLKTEHLLCRSVQNLNTYQSSFFEICSTMSSNLMDPADLYAN